MSVGIHGHTFPSYKKKASVMANNENLYVCLDPASTALVAAQSAKNQTVTYVPRVKDYDVAGTNLIDNFLNNTKDFNSFKQAITGSIGKIIDQIEKIVGREDTLPFVLSVILDGSSQDPINWLEFNFQAVLKARGLKSEILEKYMSNLFLAANFTSAILSKSPHWQILKFLFIEINLKHPIPAGESVEFENKIEKLRIELKDTKNLIEKIEKDASSMKGDQKVKFLAQSNLNELKEKIKDLFKQAKLLELVTSKK